MNSDSGWVPLSINRITNIEEVNRIVRNFIDTTESLDENLKQGLLDFFKLSKPRGSFYEEVFWPLKINCQDIPTYLIPIQPFWALNLFDQNLANQDLWGADPERHFNIENVYYRSPTGITMNSGARSLWYVSSSSKNKVSEIRACSRLLSSEINTAKNLFKKYKRLGIYKWKNLMELTKDNPDGEIMALRFFQTEYFKKPISLDEFPKYGINGQPFSPKHITSEQFINIYTNGMNKDE